MGTLNYQNANEAHKEIVKTWRMKLFGPSRRDVWNALAAEIGARMEKGDWAKSDRVLLEVSPCWHMVLDLEQQGKVTYTRMRAPFVNVDGLRFRVYRKSIFSNLAKKLGMQDIEVGDPFFDDKFIVKSNQPERVRQLLRNKRVRRLIEKQPKVYLHVLDDEGWFGAKFPDGVDELRFSVPGVITDIKVLKALFLLFVETLEQLHRMGTTKAVWTGVKL